MDVRALAFLLCALLAPACALNSDIRLSKAINGFGIAMLKELRSSKENVVFSPASISIVLGMLYAGANGTSLSQLSSVLGFTNAELVERQDVLAAYKLLLGNFDNGFDTANTILIRKGPEILDQYKEDLKECFAGEARSVDFARDGTKVTEEINEWARAKTRGTIYKLLDGELPADTAAFLLSAAYFKGVWLTKFKANQTKQLPFYNYGRDEVEVPTMWLKRGLRYTPLEEFKATAVEIPYAERQFSMIILLPDDKEGLPALESVLSVDVIDKIVDGLTHLNVELWFPKFSFSNDHDLVPALRKMGLQDVFTDDANLSGIDGGNDLRVSDVKHKAVIEVNEEGTVAAAVTWLSLILRSSFRPRHLPPVTIRVDHPFCFLIWDKFNQRAVFMGTVQKL